MRKLFCSTLASALLLLMLFIPVFGCLKKTVVISPAKAWRFTVGEQVILSGTAVNAKSGAMLLGDNFSIWIDGLNEWPKGFYRGGSDGVRLVVTGSVIERYDLPTFVERVGEPKRTGIPTKNKAAARKAAHRYLIKNAKWERIGK